MCVQIQKIFSMSSTLRIHGPAENLVGALFIDLHGKIDAFHSFWYRFMEYINLSAKS